MKKIKNVVMNMRFCIFILFVSLLCIPSFVYSQNKQENKKENKTKTTTVYDKKTKTTTIFHHIQGVSRKAPLTLIAPTTRIPTIVKTTGMRDTVSAFVVHDTIIVKGSEVRFAFKFDERISYLELVGVGRASRADIKAGKWEVTVKPTKTTIIQYKCREEGRLISQAPGVGFLVIVVDSEAELQEAWEKYKKALEQQPVGWKTKFL